MERKLTTIVAMDVVGYSRAMERDETGTLERLKATRQSIFTPAIDRQAGRLVKLMGDGALAEFSSVVGALQAAVDIQNELIVYNDAVEDNHRIQLRIGIHLGDVIVEGDDIYGDGVNVAARLEGIAPPGGIVLSKQVHDHIGTNVPVHFISLGDQSFKNISRPIQVYLVDQGREPGPDTICFADFELDTALFEIRRAGTPIPVEPQVFDLIAFLAKNQGRTVTKEEIFAEIWGDRIVSDAALSGQIKAARRVLGDDGATQKMIATVHGRGIRFIPPLENGTPAATAQSDPVGDATDQEGVAIRPTVAILPFTNLNHDSSEDYFADGITEDITTALARNRWLTVVARNPAFAFRNTTESIRTIGQNLQANYIVTGSVRKAGNRFRISTQMVDVETEHSLWSERFDRDLVDVFELQDEISDLVAAGIEIELGISEQRKAERRPRKNRGAWDLYQLGSAEFYKFTPQSNLKCQELLRQSSELDPEFASAYSRLAYAIILGMIYFDMEPDKERMDEALAAAQHAIELDDKDANSYFTLGRVFLARREYDLAIEALEFALELNPHLAVSYCGLGDSLAYEGRLDEAIEQFETAINLSPHDPFRWAFFSYRSLAHLFRGEYADAARWARKSVQIPNAQYWARAHLVSAVGHMGNRENAETAARELLEVKPEFSIEFAKKHLFYLKLADQLEIYLDGLRKAGISEVASQE